MTNTDAIDYLISCGVTPAKAKRVITACGSYGLANLTRAELMAHSVPESTARAVVGALAFAKRAVSVATMARETIGRPESVYDLLRHEALADTERFWVIGVDMRNGLLGHTEIAAGSLGSVEVHPREVFRALIRMNAAGGVLAHNHPSGDPTPSPEDHELTTRLRDAGRLLGIPIIDHVVIASQGFRSIFATHGGL